MVMESYTKAVDDILAGADIGQPGIIDRKTVVEVNAYLAKWSLADVMGVIAEFIKKDKNGEYCDTTHAEFMDESLAVSIDKIKDLCDGLNNAHQPHTVIFEYKPDECHGRELYTKIMFDSIIIGVQVRPEFVDVLVLDSWVK